MGQLQQSHHRKTNRQQTPEWSQGRQEVGYRRDQGWKRAKKSAQPSLPFGVVSDSVVPHVGRDAIPTSDLTFWLGLTQERRDLIRFLNGRLK